jgi:pantoate--beta-alanine ligase
MKITATFAETRALAGGCCGLVPTMGFLHEGHLSLAGAAERENDIVVMSLFVNPLQFGEDEDLDRYPRDVEGDAALAAEAGVDVLFAPPVEEMYTLPPLTRVEVAGMGDRLEGAARPGHFTGVATVVSKLFAGIQPDRAYFGRKDAQQLAIVKRTVVDLSFPVEVVGVPIVREQGGLALSSRNWYLSTEERRAAEALSRGLMAAGDAAEAGVTDGAELTQYVWDTMTEAPAVEPEYAALVAVQDLAPVERLDRASFLAVAAQVGPARLIDNIHLDLVDGGFVADRGVELTAPSILYRDRATEPGQSPISQPHNPVEG